MKRTVFGMRLAILTLVVGCGSSDSSPAEPSTGTHADAGSAAGHVTADAGGSHVADASGSVPTTTTGHPDAGGSTTPPTSHADAGVVTGAGDAGSTGDAGSKSDAGATGGTGSGTTVTGTLGALGPAMPIVSSLVIFTGSETIVYLSTAPVACSLISGRDGSRWLNKLPAGSQVVELVVSGAARVGDATFPEVNYAPGGMSSANEKNASLGSGKVSFTKAEAMGVVEGTFSATYANPTGSVSGTFHAEFCADGQEF